MRAIPRLLYRLKFQFVHTRFILDHATHPSSEHPCGQEYTHVQRNNGASLHP